PELLFEQPGPGYQRSLFRFKVVYSMQKAFVIVAFALQVLFRLAYLRFQRFQLTLQLLTQAEKTVYRFGVGRIEAVPVKGTFVQLSRFRFLPEEPGCIF